jgi:hypothetical protein
MCLEKCNALFSLYVVFIYYYNYDITSFATIQHVCLLLYYTVPLFVRAICFSSSFTLASAAFLRLFSCVKSNLAA